jgi:YD repeat-containing protein
MRTVLSALMAIAVVAGGVVAIVALTRPAPYDGPSAAEQGGAPNPSEPQSPCAGVSSVNCASGAFWQQFTDASLPEPGGALELTRTYSSTDASAGSPFGFGWSFSFGMTLTRHSDAMTVHQENGSTVTFTPVGTGFTAPQRVLATLSHTKGGFTFTRYSGHERFYFDNTGGLTSESDVTGETIVLHYNGNRLDTVAKNQRTLSFGYSGDHITSVTDPMRRTTRYHYDSAGNLDTVTDAAGQQSHFRYAKHLLVAVTDPQGLVTTVSYDSSNPKIRAIAACLFAGRGCVAGEDGRTARSGGGVEGDVVAQCLQLADMVADTALGVGAGVVVARPKVGVVDVLVAEQVPDDDQDGAAHRDDGPFLTPTSGDAPGSGTGSCPHRSPRASTSPRG